MRKLLFSLFLALALALSASMSWAAQAGIDNAVGGAAITYWTCKDGFETLVNIQNVREEAIGVHIVIFDQDSKEIMDFTVPLSAYDNWGASITCEDGLIRVTPVGSFYQGPNNGSEVRHAPSGAVEGYITAAITAMDGDCNGDGNKDVEGAPCANGDPRDEVKMANYKDKDINIPNGIILRSAMVNYAAGNAFALNSVALVEFRNWSSKYNGICSPADDTNGVKISFCELTNIIDPERINMQNVVGFVVGSYTGKYWARYGENEMVDTTLVMVFPAMGGNNDLEFNIYDDNELHQSAYKRVPEVARISLMGPYDTEGDLAAFESGEIYIKVKGKKFANLEFPMSLAMFGFSLVEGPGFVDIYPIVRECSIIGTTPYGYGPTCRENNNSTAPAPSGSEGSCPGGICP